MSNTATRLITLIMLLQRQPNQNATQLAQTLAVSVRTVQRYIAMLEEMGIPIYAEHGPYGGYALVRGYKMPPLIFTPEEAVAIYLGTGLLEEVWGPLYLEAARGALAKLDNVLPDEQQREVAWAQQSLLTTGMHTADPQCFAPHLTQLRNAIREQRRVQMCYQGRGQSEPTQRTFDPYILAHTWGWQYCIGYCHLRQAIRSFRMDRILAVALLDQTFAMPTDFDIQAYLVNEPFFQTQVRVRLYFAPEDALAGLDQRPYWDTVTEQADGSLVVSFTALNLGQAAGVVLGNAPLATVIEPPALVELVRERAAAIAARHAPTRTSGQKSVASLQTDATTGNRRLITGY